MSLSPLQIILINPSLWALTAADTSFEMPMRQVLCLMSIYQAREFFSNFLCMIVIYSFSSIQNAIFEISTFKFNMFIYF